MDREGWNRRYAGKQLVWGAEPNRFLVRETASLPPGRALDLAAGEGRNAIWLAERGWRTLAVDFSDVALERAARLAERRGVSIERLSADLTAGYAPEPGAYDLVIVMYLHLPLGVFRPVLKRACEALAPGGVLLVVGHDRTNLESGHGGPQDPAVLYTEREVAEALHGVTIERAEKVVRTVQTGGGEAEAIDCLVRASHPSGRT